MLPTWRAWLSHPSSPSLLNRYITLERRAAEPIALPFERSMGSRCNKFNYLLNALVSGEVSYGRVGSLITAAGRVRSQHAAAAPPPAKGRSGINLGVTSRLKHIHNFINICCRWAESKSIVRCQSCYCKPYYPGSHFASLTVITSKA